tara:strand:+ start:198 stop:407 length:210 start_codon:yes stop_codon:yes gene_type:complete
MISPKSAKTPLFYPPRVYGVNVTEKFSQKSIVSSESKKAGVFLNFSRKRKKKLGRWGTFYICVKISFYT